MAGESFDAASEPHGRSSENTESNQQRDKRQFLGVRFDCCRTYARVYVNQNRTAFVGHCPRCGKPVHIKISPDGMDAKFISAS